MNEDSKRRQRITEVERALAKAKATREYRDKLSRAADHFFENGYFPNFEDSLKKLLEAVAYSKNMSYDDQGCWHEVTTMARLLKHALGQRVAELDKEVEEAESLFIQALPPKPTAK